ncbi:MAG TPA: hypothetical protein VG900_14645 [Hyphomicrobiaceae bacterium]|nr:hypothetical protein [Hyphomicrobiaceae bacterium]
MMGNRGGALHLPDKTLGSRRWVTKQWIACLLEFKGRHREVMQPNRYTELFFLDEATALAAGHRPCFECRRKDAELFSELWARTRHEEGRARAPAMDEELHAERLQSDRGKRTFRARLADIPNGAFVRYARHECGGQTCPHLVLGRHLLAWSAAGYAALVSPSAIAEEVDVLTPPSIVAILAAGYRPMLHPSATALLA